MAQAVSRWGTTRASVWPGGKIRSRVTAVAWQLGKLRASATPKVASAEAFGARERVATVPGSRLAAAPIWVPLWLTNEIPG